MTEFLKKRPKTLAFGQLIFIYCWLSNLQKTDSRMSVYLLCAVIGVLCLCDNYRQRISLSRRNAVWLGIFAGLFSFATLLANYALFEPIAAVLSLFNGGCSFLAVFPSDITC